MRWGEAIAGAYCLVLTQAGNGELDSSVPVIAVHANVLAGDRERCLAARMDDYLAKPLDPQLLGAMLRRLVLMPDATQARPT